ncbi:PAS domain S-box protein [Rhodobacteraceae bacterium D3-12]|nr:PAS domain S-box protein [Rhodobacteraceae bacterium D3-12]
MLITFGLYSLSSTRNAALADREFKLKSRDHLEIIRSRFDAHLQSINGVAAFMISSSEVTPNDFTTYVNSLNLGDHLHGLNGMGIVVEVADADLDSFVQYMHAQGHPDFQLRRLSDEPVHYIIKQMSPKATNSGAWGLDITFSPELKALLEETRATGQTKMSHPITLAQAAINDSLGYVLYKPLFKPTLGSTGQGTFIGWADVPVFVHNLLGIQGTTTLDSAYLHVSDGRTADEQLVVYDNRPDPALLGNFSFTHEMERFGRHWTITYYSSPAFDAAFAGYQPYVAVVFSLMITLLLLSIMRSNRMRQDTLAEVAALRFRQIKASEEENRSIIQNSVLPVLILDGHKKITFANQAALSLFGYSQLELVNAPFDTLVTRTDAPGQNYNALASTKTNQTLELEVQINNWKTFDGEPRITAIMRDLSDKNEAQRNLKRSRALFDLALQGAEIGVFNIDLETGTSSVTETWCKIMGIDADPSEVDGQIHFLDRVHPDDLPIIEAADEACIKGHAPRSIAEYRIKDLDGSWRWMQSNAGCVERDENGLAKRLIGTQIDITKLRDNQRALEASERRFRQVVENAPIGMALIDFEGNFTGVNKAMCHLAGMSEAELVGKTAIADVIPHDDRKTLYTAISKLIDEGEESVYTAEHRILHASGTESWCLFNVSWSRESEDSDMFFIGQIIDISEQKRLEKTKNEFVSTVSHELRTPLTSIKGALGLLTVSQKDALAPNQLRLIEIASSNADKLAYIVNDILDLEKISAGKLNFYIQDADLCEMVSETVTQILPFAKTHDNTIKIVMPDDLPQVHMDETRAGQVLANLVSNACKYSDPDTEILVKTERLGDQAITFVQNIGPGIPESFRSHIFDAFSQADASDTRAKGGTGLGLNIARLIVERMNGQIGFESQEGGITVFWFTLPLAQSEASTPQLPAPQDSEADDERLSILHIESDDDCAALTADALSKLADVTRAKTFLDAQGKIRTTAWDVIIFDWDMPNGAVDRLLDEITRAQPRARLIALGSKGATAEDPRLFASHEKSHHDMSHVAESVTECLALAS